MQSGVSCTEKKHIDYIFQGTVLPTISCSSVMAPHDVAVIDDIVIDDIDIVSFVCGFEVGIFI